MATLIAIWNKVKSNPFFVAASGAAMGAMASALQDGFSWSGVGLRKMAVIAGTAAFIAVVHLYRDPPQSKTTGTTTAVLVLCCGFAGAQAPPTPPGLAFTASGDAINFRAGSQGWTLGALAREDLSLLTLKDSKGVATGSVDIIGSQLLAPGVNLTGYFGGLQYAPVLSSLIAKTNLPANAFTLALEAQPGVVKNAAQASHFGVMAGGVFSYILSPAVSLNVLRFGYMDAPGFGGRNSTYYLSLGLATTWGRSPTVAALAKYRKH